MKKRVLNNVILLIVSAFLCLTVGFAGLFAAETKASAETAADGNLFEMVEAASVRLDNPSGIRFQVRIGANVKAEIEQSEEKGFLIFPKAYLKADVTGDYKNTLYSDRLDIPVDASTIYAEKIEGTATGYYLCNGVMHGIKNYNLDFSSIAYYKNAEGSYVYASFDRSFGRTMSYVLSKDYLANSDNREAIEETFSWFGSESAPLSITDADDMIAFAEAVNDGCTFENEYVSLTNDIELSGFATLRGDSFKGTFDYNGKTVTMKDGGKPIIAGSASTVENESVIGAEYAFKATSGSAINFEVGTKKGTVVANSDIANKSDDYTGNAAKIENLTSGSILTLNLNYTKDELTALKSQYNKATVSFMLTGTATGESTPSFNDNVGSDTETTSKHAGIVSKTGLTSLIAVNKWHTYTISLDDLIATMGLELKSTSSAPNQLADNQALLTRIWLNNMSSADAYVGDIVLSYESPTLLKTSAENVNNVFGTVTKTFVDNATLKTTFTDGDIGGYTGGAIAISRNRAMDIVVKIDLSAEEITELKSKYSQIVFNFGVEYNEAELTKGVYLSTVNENYAAGIINKAGVTSFTNKKWYTETISIDDFIAAITAAQAIDSKYAQMVYFMRTDCNWNERTYSFNVYIGDIEFVAAN